MQARGPSGCAGGRLGWDRAAMLLPTCWSCCAAVCGRPGCGCSPATVPRSYSRAATSLVLACNTQHTGAGMRIAPRARLDDGLLDLLIVPELSRARLLALMWRIPSGRHLEVPELRYRQVSGFELLAGKGGGRPGRDGWCLNVDGEILRGTQAAVLEVSVRRGALKLLSAPSR
jgi:diacylglycerol kinase family enzyme